jgi:hypothetical protein
MNNTDKIPRILPSRYFVAASCITAAVLIATSTPSQAQLPQESNPARGSSRRLETDSDNIGKVYPLAGWQRRDFSVTGATSETVFPAEAFDNTLRPGMAVLLNQNGGLEIYKNPFNPEDLSRNLKETQMQSVFEDSRTDSSRYAFFSLSMSGSYKSFASMSAKYQQAESRKESRQTLYFGFFTDWGKQTYVPQWSDTELNSLDRGEFTDAFLGRYGTHYVQEVNYGVMYLIEASIENDSVEAFKEFKGFIQVKVLGSGGKVDLEVAIKEAQSKYAVTFKTKLVCDVKNSRGGTNQLSSGVLVATSPAQMAEAIDKLRSGNIHFAPAPLSFTLASYRNVRKASTALVPEVVKALYGEGKLVWHPLDHYMPVGSIIASMLPYVMLSPEEKASWWPADGTPVPPDSLYAQVRNKMWSEEPKKCFAGEVEATTGTALFPVHSPDLRGQFLRGLNGFTADKPERKDGKEDPDRKNSVAGDPQLDSFQRHELGGSGLFLKRGRGFPVDRDAQHGTGAFTSGSDGGTVGFSTLGLVESGGNETRPRNVAVYYYLKIN